MEKNNRDKNDYFFKEKNCGRSAIKTKSAKKKLDKFQKTNTYG